MKTGRNEPCPCGSGKKYKKCCLNTDLEKKDELGVVENNLSGSGPHDTKRSSVNEPTGETDLTTETRDEIDLLWEKFEKSDLEEQVTLFKDALNNAEIMDGGLAFDMIDQICLKSTEIPNKIRVIKLIELLYEKLPDIFQENAAYHIHILISCAIVTDQREKVAFWAPEIVECGIKDFEVFNWVVEQLAYHGYLPILLTVMRAYWNAVKKSDDILPFGIGEFSIKTVFYEIVDYIQTTSIPEANDPELVKRIKGYGEFDKDRLNRYAGALIETDLPRWTSDDFQTEGHSLSLIKDNIFSLCLEFLGFLQRDSSIPFTRAQMGAEGVCNYLVMRINGELKPKRKPSKAQKRKKQHSLCPEYGSLNRYFARSMHFLDTQNYQVAATFELVPSWLQYLRKLQLIEQEMIKPTLAELAPIAGDLSKLWQKNHEDPVLAASLEYWKNLHDFEDLRRKYR